MNCKLYKGLLMSTLLLVFVSCVKEEALNAEADIEEATIENASEFLSDEATVRSHSVQFRLKKFEGSFDFAPIFELTEGATISPSNGTVHDFSVPQDYVVSSEDGNWQKTYSVSFTIDDVARHNFSFESVEVINTTSPEGHYHNFFEYLPNGQKSYEWDTGNEGYNILAAAMAEEEGVELTPAFYPTAQTENGFEGKAAKLQTKDTGPLGGMVGSELAAGNLFLGNFVFTFPAIKSPRFGQTYNFDSAPVALKGFFKYEKGEEFEVNNDSGSELTEDTFNIYSVLFEKQESDNYLSGDFDYEDPRIVAIAKIDPQDRIETAEWTEFSIPFEFKEGESFDANTEYMFTIVFTSSLEGDLFNGAVGSTLWIDEVELITEDQL